VVLLPFRYNSKRDRGGSDPVINVMKKSKLRKEVYQGCHQRFCPLISQIDQYVTLIEPPVPLSRIMSYSPLWTLLEEEKARIRKEVKSALFLLSQHSLISDTAGYITPEKNYVQALEFWYLPEREPSLFSLLTTIYTTIRGEKMSYHMLQQYTPSTPGCDTLNEIYWNYLGRFGTYVPIYAVIPFSTPEDVVNYPRWEEVEMISQLVGMGKDETVCLLKARILNHMHSIGLTLQPRKSVFGRWWLQKKIFYHLEYPAE